MKRLLSILLIILMTCSSVLTSNVVKAEEGESVEEVPAEVQEETAEEPVSESQEEESSTIEEDEIELNNTDPTILDSGNSGAGSTFTLYSDYSMVITGTGMADVDLIDDEPFTEYYASVQKITIGDGVTAICDNVFEGYTSLKTVKLPSNANFGIGNNAFKNCTSLEMVFVPDDSVIGAINDVDSPFYGCPDGIIYTNASCENSNWGDGWNAISATSDSYVHYNTPVTEFDYWVNLSKTATKVVISSEITVLPDGIFTNNSSIEEAIIPSTVTEISNDCFKNCTSLEYVYIPSSVTSIGTNAFAGCSSLETICIPSSVTSIGTDDASESPFYGSNSLYIYVDFESDISTYGSCWNYYDGTNTLNFGTYHEHLEGFVYTYDAATDAFFVSGTDSELLSATTIPDEYPEVGTAKPVSGIKANTFNNNTVLVTLTIPDTIAVIEEDAFASAGVLTDLIYEGTKEEWDAIDIEGEEDILAALDITFENGVHDHTQNITVYQEEDKDIIIEADTEFLEDFTEKTVCNYIENIHTDGGSLWLGNGGKIENVEVTARYDGYGNTKTVERTYIELNEDHTKAIIPYSTICISCIYSGQHTLTLNGGDISKEITVDIEGVEELTTQPTVTLLENGDIKIEADSDYLNALMHTYNYYDLVYASARRTIQIDTEYEEDEYEYAAGCNMQDKPYAEREQILTLSEDGTYVLFSNDNQKYVDSGVLVNGSATLTLYAYGYEASDEFNLILTQNYEVAPDDVTVSYSDGFIRITSTNTRWLSQLEKYVLVSTDLTELSNWHVYSINQIGSIQNNTLTISTISNGFEAGSYYLIVCGGGYYGYYESTFSGSANNKMIGPITIDEKRTVQTISYSDYQVSFEKNKMVISSTNEDWLDAICADSNGELTDEEILSLGYGIYPADGYILLSAESDGGYIVFRNTEDNEVIHKETGKVYINYSDIEAAGLKIYKGLSYHLKIYGYGYTKLDRYYITANNGTAISSVPSDLKFKEDANGNLVLTSKNNLFFNNMDYISIYNDNYIVTIFHEDLTIENGKATIAAEDLKLDNGTFSVSLYSYGFKNYTKSKAVKLTHHSLIDAPEFSLSIDENGDLLITSQDENWINILAKNGNRCRVAMVRKTVTDSPYADSYGHTALIYRNLTKRDANTIVFSVSNQKNYSIVNGVYKIQFRVDGYRISDYAEVEFTDSYKDIPSDLAVTINENVARVSTTDTDFIDNISTSNYGCYIYTGYTKTYNNRSLSETVSWPIEIGDIPGFGYAGGAWGSVYVTPTKNVEDGYADFDISSLSASSSDVNILHVAMVNNGDYRYVEIPLNTETYEIRYHSNLDDSDPTGSNNAFVYYYTKNLEKFSYKIPSLTKEGYKFDGWYSDANYKKKVTTVELKKTTGDVDLYAKFTPIKYTIKYNLNGGKNNPTNKSTYIYTDNIVFADPTRTGYTFDGWFTTKTFEEGSQVDTINAGSTGNVILYAKWTPITYTIQYVSDKYSSNVIEISYDQSYKLSDIALPNPGKKAQKYTYTVNGKSKTVSATSTIKNLVNTNGQPTIEFHVTKSKEKELWSTATYTITYNLNGGTQNPKNKKSYTMGKEVTLYEPTRKGYRFAGWTDENMMACDSISSSDFGNKTFTANWSNYIYYITLDVNGGNLPSGYEETISYTVEDTVTLPVPTRANYTFAGWYNGKTKATAIRKGTIGNITLTAKWTEGTNYTIVYDKNSDSATGKMSNTKVTAGKNVTLTSFAYKLTGKVFVEWNTKQDGTGISYKNKATILKSNPLSSEGGKTVTLYAIWDGVKSFTIQYDANEGTGNMKNQSMKNSSYKALTANTYTRKGYTFTGWNTAADGSGISYKNKETYYAYKGEGGDTVTLYAQWTPITYRITYKNTKSSDHNENPVTYTVLDEDIELLDAGRDNYHFCGWYADSKFKNEITSINTGDCRNITVYAKYVKAKSLTYANYTSATQRESVTLTIGSDITSIGHVPYTEIGSEGFYPINAETITIKGGSNILRVYNILNCETYLETLDLSQASQAFIEKLFVNPDAEYPHDSNCLQNCDNLTTIYVKDEAAKAVVDTYIYNELNYRPVHSSTRRSWCSNVTVTIKQ